VDQLWDGSIAFHYESAEGALEHLLKSGAGTAFYDAIDPERRDALKEAFVRQLQARHPAGGGFEVVHDYIACIASKA